MQKVPMTVHGAEKLREELQELKTVVRPRIIAAIAEARAHGDLRENAEYHSAKEQQGFTEGRIQEIESKLGNAQIIDVRQAAETAQVTDKVIFGSTVELLRVDTDEVVKYQIVGEDEADLKSGKISFHSPIARAIMSKLSGDVVDVQAPGGIISYEILCVEYL
ncbi:MAG: transcription elongation factor GreA [Gammaproteobacteria bacterium]